MATGADDGSLALTRLRDGRLLRLVQRRGAPIWSAAFSSDEQVLFTAAHDGVLRGYRVDDGRIVLHRRITSSPLISLAVSARHLAVGAGDGRVHVTGAGGTGDVRTLDGHGQTIYGLAFDPSGRQLASGSADWSVRLWNVERGSLTAVLDDFDEAVFSLAFDPAGRRLAVACGGGTIHVLEAR